MKKILLLFVLLSALHSVKASDTLTIRQIFNFDVGDTFDYKTSYSVNIWNNNCNGYPGDHHDYIRYVITDKIVSPANDSLKYVRKQLYPHYSVDTLKYTNLDSSVFLLFDTTGISQYVLFDSVLLSDGRLTNSLRVTIPLAAGYSNTYGAGLGMTYAM